MSEPRKLLQALTVLCFLASTCAPAQTALPATSVAASTASQTPRPIPTLTATQPPTDTPDIAAFDLKVIFTPTHMPAAECPKEKPNVSPMNILPEDLSPFYYDSDFGNRVIKFLNIGGSTTSLITELKKPNEYGQAYAIVNQVDITNDELPELLINVRSSYFILKCDKQNYIKIFDMEETVYAPHVSIIDLNQNFIPELEVSIDPCAGTNCIEMWIFEWDGAQLKTLLHSTDDFTFTTDLNNDGFQEVIGSEYPDLSDTEPTDRRITTIYSWNGMEFEGKPFFSDAEYRFQAIQDADNATAQGQYSKAFKLYASAISSKILKAWSPTLDEYFNEFSYEETPTPTPIPDPTEYPRLAAYAYYRMIALHTHLGQLDAATIQYTTLQEKFPVESPGYPYAEMSSIFWDAYQASQNMTSACGAAIQYAVEHPDILVVLGSDYHGEQSHKYIPEDVCPFR